jgi:hypothetical protein
MSTFTKQAAKAARNLRDEAKRTLSGIAMLKHPAVKAAFEAFPLNMRKHVNMSMSGYSSMVYISVTVRDLNSFKDAKLARVLEHFVDWGTTVNEYTTGDSPNKDFSFTKMFDDTRDTKGTKCASVEIRVSIYSYVKSDSPLCRIVVTGVTERVVREETKQIVCA